MTKLPHYKIDDSLLIPQRQNRFNKKTCVYILCFTCFSSSICFLFIIFMNHVLTIEMNSNSTINLSLMNKY